MDAQRNWSDTYTFTAARIHRPNSVDELRRLAAAAPRIRALGARHSFNGVADSEELVELGALAGAPDIDRERGIAWVPAAMTYGQLSRQLHAEGWALHNMGSLPHITVAGATATGTHGSGDRNGSLASAVAAIELVTADGNLLILRRGEPDFPGVAVGLGAFGIATRIALDIQPTFDIRQDAFADLPWSRVLADFDAIMSAAYSVSLFTHWGEETVSRLWLKTLATESGAQASLAERLAASATERVFAHTPELDLAMFTPFGSAGPWSERLCHFLPDVDPGTAAQIQSEYMVPRDRAVAAIGLMREMGTRIDKLLILTEIRTVMRDDLWLSSSYGHDVVALHFTWKHDMAQVAPITREIEAKLLPLGARPHWGKLMHADAASIARLYPRLDDFRALACRYDPAGKFRNAFLERHVFGGSDTQRMAA
ncbi:MAG: FAD-binding protein [Acidisphaera sp.]|nr:FAD-binding protein [Acidisphaera sp.]